MPKRQMINPENYLKEQQRKLMEALVGKDLPPGSYVVFLNPDGTVKEIRNANK